MHRVLLPVLILALLSGCGQPPEIETVRITTADGFELAGTWLVPDGATQGVVLFNECGPQHTQQQYAPLAEALAADGYAVLTHDFRGTGESRTDEADLTNPAHLDAIRSRFGNDTRNLLGYAMTRFDIVAAVGAGCGAFRLADLSMDMTDLRALVALSGGSTDHGVELLQARPDIRVLSIASGGDASSFTSAQEMVQDVGTSATFMSVTGSLSGTALLTGDNDVLERIVTFVDESISRDPVNQGPIGRMASFSAVYTQSGIPMALSVSNPTPGMTRSVMQMQQPGTGRILADSIEHNAQGMFLRRAFDFMGERHERVLAGVARDSLVVLRQDRDGGPVTRSAQPLLGPLVDATWSYWMLGTMDLAESDSVAVPTWRMTPDGAIQVISVFHRANEARECTWWDARNPAFILRSCVTDEPPYLIRQEAVLPDGSRQPVLELERQ